MNLVQMISSSIDRHRRWFPVAIGLLTVLAIVASAGLAWAQADAGAPQVPDAVQAALAASEARAKTFADQAWVLVAACLVFFMQTGFLALEVGFVRRKAIVITAMKNLADWTVCVIAFFFCGWALMFGHSQDGLIGGDGWMLAAGEGASIGVGLHFVFNLAFAATAATIVSGAMAERTGFLPYVICSAVVTAIIYPVVGHWVWGNGYYSDNSTLLTQWGFIDFAGSTVVHSVGGWVALIGMIVIGPRIGRFDQNGKPVNLGSYSLAWAAMGVLILWFGWWGFNGGSTLSLDGDAVALIIAKTNIAGAAAGISAMMHAKLLQDNSDVTPKFMGGLLGGLVAITANCHMVSPEAAVVIGLVAGVLHNIAYEALLKFRIDDPVGAVPVHLVCGVWGTLAVGIFGHASGFGDRSRLEQIGVQGLGIAIVAVWTIFIALVTFLLLKRYVGLRVSPQDELIGYDIGGTIEHQPDDDDGLGADDLTMIGEP
ncbi:MAG: ammonium transporter [Kofleriaceae bacterium]